MGKKYCIMYASVGSKLQMELWLASTTCSFCVFKIGNVRNPVPKFRGVRSLTTRSQRYCAYVYVCTWTIAIACDGRHTYSNLIIVLNINIVAMERLITPHRFPTTFAKPLKWRVIYRQWVPTAFLTARSSDPGQHRRVGVGQIDRICRPRGVAFLRQNFAIAQYTHWRSWSCLVVQATGHACRTGCCRSRLFWRRL